MAVSSVNSTSTQTSSVSNGIGGLATGMNTDDLVAKLTLGSKNKVIKEQAITQKLLWKQTAYRDVTASLANFKSTYFDTLSTTNFKNPSIPSKDLVTAVLIASPMGFIPRISKALLSLIMCHLM